MEKPNYELCSLKQLMELIQYGKTDEMANEAWKRYKKKGGDDWEYFALNGKTDEIANEAWKRYKDNGGDDWKYFAEYGKKEMIINEAKSRIYDISEFLSITYDNR